MSGFALVMLMVARPYRARAKRSKLAAFAMLMSIEAAIDNLACDYDCFFSRAHPLIYVTCPPEAASEPILMPPG